MPFTAPPSVATDTNYDAGSDTWSGLPTKRAPTAGQIAKGIIPGAKLTAQLFNYLMNAFGARITELQAAFPGSTTDNTIPRWNGTDGTSLQTSGVAIEDDNDVTGAKDVTVSGEYYYSAAKTRTVVLPARRFVPVAGTAWAWSDTDHRWQIPANSSAADYMWLDFSLPVGVQITKFEILVESTEGNLRGMGCRLFEKAYAASFGDGTDIGGGAASAAVNANVIGIAQQTINTPGTTVSATYRIRGQKGSPSGAGATFDRLGDVRITFLDPGPRTA